MNSHPLIYCNIEFVPEGADLESIAKVQQLFHDRVIYFPAAMNPRAEMTPNPWKLKLPDEYRIPDLPENFNLTFADITDRRAQEIAKLCEDKNLSLVCQWSGGIDSTVIMAAIIKNFPQHLLSRVHVYMNNISYLENPIFFDRVIKKYGFSYGRNKLDWDQAMITLGYPADPLWGHADLLELERFHPGSWKNHPKSKPDELLSWLRTKSSKDLVDWFYEIMIQSSDAAGIELTTYEDFYWWNNFNLVYASQSMHGYTAVSQKITPETYKKYHGNIVPWYHSDDYQIWSIVNRSRNVKFDGTIRNYKKEAKDYIFDVDKNPYYRDYKSKTISARKSNKVMKPLLYALYEDGTTVYEDLYC